MGGDWHGADLLEKRCHVDMEERRGIVGAFNLRALNRGRFSWHR